jgi:hypothetical protein
MNSLDWFAQILLAGVFLFDGIRRIIACSRQKDGQPAAQPHQGMVLASRAACAVGFLEIACALAFVAPVQLWRPDVLPLLAASILFALTGASLIYHLRHQRPSAPVLAVFLLMLLAIIGRWA